MLGHLTSNVVGIHDHLPSDSKLAPGSSVLCLDCSTSQYGSQATEKARLGLASQVGHVTLTGYSLDAIVQQLGIEQCNACSQPFPTLQEANGWAS